MSLLIIRTRYRPPSLRRGAKRYPGYQHGFSLPEALIAALFFSVSLLGLLQYHQVLVQGFSSLWQRHQAWILLHQHVESVVDGLPEQSLNADIKPGWQYHHSTGRTDGECTEFNFTLSTGQNYHAELSRWFCFVRG